MSRDLNALLQNLQNVKAASINPEAVTDPNVGGTKTDVAGEDLHQPTGANTSTADLPDKRTLPGGIETAPLGNAGVGSPESKPFVESGKSATELQADIKGLMGKLAGIRADVPASTTPAAPAATAPAATATTPAPAKAASEGGERRFGQAHMEIATNLMKSASGRQLMETALNEIMGKEACANLIKEAAADVEKFEQGYLTEKMAAYEDQLRQQEIQRAEADRQQAYAAWRKSASAEEIQKADDTADIIKVARAKFIDHPVALAHFDLGIVCAEKYAAAMDAAAAGVEGAPADPADAIAPGPEGEPSIEEIAEALAMAVQSGKMTEEQAQEILDMILGGGGGEGGAPPGAEGGMPPGAEGGMPPGAEGGGPPPEAGPPMPEEKVASIEEFLGKVASAIEPALADTNAA